MPCDKLNLEEKLKENWMKPNTWIVVAGQRGAKSEQTSFLTESARIAHRITTPARQRPNLCIQLSCEVTPPPTPIQTCDMCPPGTSDLPSRFKSKPNKQSGKERSFI